MRRSERSVRRDVDTTGIQTARLASMSSATAIRLPGFWQVQAGSWVALYAFILLPALPHLRQSGVFAYNTWAVALLFASSVALRPALRYGSARWNASWLRLEAFAFALCFVAGSIATLLTALLTFGMRGFRWSYWTLSGEQCAMVLFLWATLYLSVKHWRLGPGETLGQQEAPALTQARYPARFIARVGSRLQIIDQEQVLWVAAARDYAELHTQNSVHLLRETLTSIEKKLDPERFLRIHRSRIVRVDQIVELATMDNSEYRVKLRDGSEHRTSRTYAPSLTKWMHSGVDKPRSG